MTATRSQTCRTTARSCETNRQAIAEARLQLDQQVEDLRAHRNVERGDRLVADEQRGAQRQRAGDDDALPLAAGKLVRVALRVFRPAARRRRAAPRRARAVRCRAAMPRTSRGSPIAAPTVMRGLSEVAGSWNTICALGAHGAQRAAHRRRRVRCRARECCRASARPVRRSALETVDLPQPLSPTRPSVSPAARGRSDTPSTARTGGPWPRPGNARRGRR